MQMNSDDKGAVIIVFIIAMLIASVIIAGIQGNNYVTKQRSEVAKACVTSGGSWDDERRVCSRD